MKLFKISKLVLCFLFLSNIAFARTNIPCETFPFYQDKCLKEDRDVGAEIKEWVVNGLLIGMSLGIIDLSIQIIASTYLPLPHLQDDSLPAEISDIPSSGFVGLFLIAFVGPLTEEILFRGILQNTLYYSMGLPGAIAISSSLFGLVHLTNNFSGMYIQAILSSFSGITYGCLNHFYGFPASVAAHVTHNFAVFGLKVLADRSCDFLDLISEPELPMEFCTRS